jgi:Sulfotransferase domain
MWATRAVQWQPARNAIKYGVHAYARARGRRLERSAKLPAIANIYAASSPKAGSQWMKALLDHPLVRAKSSLLTLPQLDYQQRLDRALPLATFVPGLYMSYPEYRRIPKPHEHRVVYMFRDPRELCVSGYYSAIGTHRWTNREVERFRAQLREMPFDEALLALIRDGAPRLREVATWVDVEDPNVAKFRLEDVSASPGDHVPRILDHCGVTLPAAELDTVLSDVSRESLQAKDLAERGDRSESHYRVDRKSFRVLFKPEHHQAIEEIAPGLVERLGYPA